MSTVGQTFFSIHCTIDDAKRLRQFSCAVLHMSVNGHLNTFVWIIVVRVKPLQPEKAKHINVVQCLADITLVSHKAVFPAAACEVSSECFHRNVS